MTSEVATRGKEINERKTLDVLNENWKFFIFKQRMATRTSGIDDDIARLLWNISVEGPKREERDAIGMLCLWGLLKNISPFRVNEECPQIAEIVMSAIKN
jgi:hypothetical protein